MDTWAAGEAYEPYVGRWSRPVAAEFVSWLALPADQRWLDVGCGTGALTAAILDRADPASVAGVDPSEGFVAYAATHVTDPRARFTRGSATELPPENVDAVVSGLVLNFVPDAAAALAAMAAAAPGGLVAAYVWDYAEGMELMRHFWDVAVALNPAAAHLDEGRRFPLCRPDALRELWGAAGLTEVDVRSIEVPTVFADFDDYWAPFLGGQAPAPTYAMGLTEDRRAQLRDALRNRLSTGGAIRLRARAWAVRGRVPAGR